MDFGPPKGNGIISRFSSSNLKPQNPHSFYILLPQNFIVKYKYHHLDLDYKINGKNELKLRFLI